MTSNTKQAPQLPQMAVSGSRYVPMLFSTPMVLALLDKTKTETRRTQGLEKINENPDNWVFKQVANLFYFTNKFKEETICIKSKMNVGDIIWVRETFQNSLNTNEYCYKADTDNPIYLDKKWKWKPSLFMPKDACRIFLKCVSVHAERLQDIDEQSAINEGIEIVPLSNIYYKDYTGNGYFQKAVFSYYSLWQKINGKDSHKENPFVWVYKFVQVDAPRDFR
jgi:hypothetical protein